LIFICKLHWNHILQQEEQELYDDGLSILTADEYVKIRLQPIISTFTRKTPALSQLSNTVTCIVIALSVCSSVFSTFDLTIFIPMALAFAGACTAWRSYKQADLRLVQTNGALNQLHQLIIWWDSLSMIEKRVPANKEFLVQTTELTIQTQVVGYLSSKNKDDSADDVNA
jgi:SMODS and SLOG-associating 2TM effector domain 1